MLTPDQIAWDISTSYRIVLAAIVLGLLVELICFRRVRRFNAWLTLLAGAAVCLQTLVVAISTTMTWDAWGTWVVVLRVSTLGFTGVALVAAWLAVRRVWVDRARSRVPLAWLRGATLSLMATAFAYQAVWGLNVVDFITTTAARG